MDMEVQVNVDISECILVGVGVGVNVNVDVGVSEVPCGTTRETDGPLANHRKKAFKTVTASSIGHNHLSTS